MIVKSDAIVMKTVDYSESSIIATLFTREKGKIAVIAKGARKPKNKFSAFLVVGQLLEVVVYIKESRSVQTLSDVSYSRKLHSFRVDIEKMALMMTTLELSNQVLHDNEVNTPLFEFLMKTLVWVDKQSGVPAQLFPYLQLRIAEYIGIGVQYMKSDESDGGYLNISSGLLSPQKEDDHAERLSPLQFAFVKKSLHSANASVLRIVMDSNELKQLIQTLDKYFIYHVEGMKPRRSDKIFDQLLMT
ncbi:DNA repair protein RecO [Rhodohalobacter sp. 8-1]|uniref:DNA repair protein RecO n=1 Tax=Rhodohalobacter sp. 8-1 TaxID=3131972 RepID=UPI0030EC2D43